MRPPLLKIHPRDNVAVAFDPLAAGSELEVGGVHILTREVVPVGHTIAFAAIPAGEHIHSHNLATELSGEERYACTPLPTSAGPAPDLQRDFRRSRDRDLERRRGALS